MISSVTTAEAGWIVVHIEKDSAPGLVIGYAPVKAGVNTNVRVDIDSAKATAKLFAMLHVDKGAMGTYEFPGVDAPTKMADKIVMTPFKVTLPGATKPATLQVAQNAAFGQFLTDDQGRTLYIFLTDAQKASTCYDACAQTWPPLLIQGSPVAGDGVDASLLTTTQRKDSTTHFHALKGVAYNGWPLYYFAADQKAGDTKGQGAKDVWYVVSAFYPLRFAFAFHFGRVRFTHANLRCKVLVYNRFQSKPT